MQNKSHAVMAQRKEAHEEWRPISGWPGYEVSDRGRVRSCKWPGKGRQWELNRERGFRILKYDVRNKYPSVVLSDVNLGRLWKSIHVLVLEEFVGPRPDGMQGAHDDGDTSNNRLRNLFWKTPVGNNKDKIAHRTHQFGELIGTAKLNASEVAEIRRRRSEREPVSALAAEYGVCRNTITNLTTGKSWGFQYGAE